MAGLLGNARQQCALLFGFGNSDSFAVYEQEVIAGAGFERCFAQGDAASGGGVELLVLLNDPATRGELRVDLLAGELFWSQIRHVPDDSCW